MGPAPSRDPKADRLAALGVFLASALLLAALVGPTSRALMGLVGLLGAAGVLWVRRSGAASTPAADPEPRPSGLGAPQEAPAPLSLPPPPGASLPTAVPRDLPDGLQLSEVDGVLWAWSRGSEGLAVVRAFCSRCLDPLTLCPIPMGGQATFTSLACARCGLHRGEAFPGDAEAVRAAVLRVLEAGSPAPSRPRGSRRRS